MVCSEVYLILFTFVEKKANLVTDFIRRDDDN